MNIKELRDTGWIVLETTSGSRAYGLEMPHSDWDIRGVYVLPTEDVLRSVPTPDGGFEYQAQISDEKGDVVFYEIGRFIELLEKGNPNILELLYAPEDCIIYKDILFDEYFYPKTQYLTKKLYNTFSGYAQSQIKKAKGMNKKTFNPQPKKRKGILDFCYIISNGNSTPFWKCFKATKIKDKVRKLETYYSKWGLTKLSNGEQLYALYGDDGTHNLKGIVKNLESTQLRLSSIPKEYHQNNNNAPMIMWFNLNGFQSHCKDHKEYWEWVEKRNPERWKDNLKGEIGFDHKNMMHCIRLIEMAQDIADKSEVVVRRPNRDYLLSIRNGEHSYKDLMYDVGVKMKDLKDFFQNSSLIEEVDLEKSRDLLQRIRLDYLFFEQQGLKDDDIVIVGFSFNMKADEVFALAVKDEELEKAIEIFIEDLTKDKRQNIEIWERQLNMVATSNGYYGAFYEIDVKEKL